MCEDPRKNVFCIYNAQLNTAGEITFSICLISLVSPHPPSMCLFKLSVHTLVECEVPPPSSQTSH